MLDFISMELRALEHLQKTQKLALRAVLAVPTRVLWECTVLEKAVMEQAPLIPKHAQSVAMEVLTVIVALLDPSALEHFVLVPALLIRKPALLVATEEQPIHALRDPTNLELHAMAVILWKETLRGVQLVVILSPLILIFVRPTSTSLARRAVAKARTTLNLVPVALLCALPLFISLEPHAMAQAPVIP